MMDDNCRSRTSLSSNNVCAHVYAPRRLPVLQAQSLRDVITTPRGRTRSIVVSPEVSNA